MELNNLMEFVHVLLLFIERLSFVCKPMIIILLLWLSFGLQTWTLVGGIVWEVYGIVVSKLEEFKALETFRMNFLNTMSLIHWEVSRGHNLNLSICFFD